LDWSARSANDAAARGRQLRQAVGDITTAVDKGRISDTQKATKQALEALHELEDCRSKRQEWSQTGWDQTSLDLWTGLTGARNAAHHLASPIVVVSSGGQADDRVRWDVEASAVQQLQSSKQQAAYTRQVAGQAVLPQLRKVLALVEAAVL
jgi:hypothetical protein